MPYAGICYMHIYGIYAICMYDGLLSPLQVRGVWGRGPGVEGEVEGEGGG